MFLTATLLSAFLAGAATGPMRPSPTPSDLPAMAATVEPQALGETLTALVGFGTRHTLSETHSEARGIGAARAWTRRRFETLSQACGGCLEIQTPESVVSGPRIPGSVVVQDVLAVQKGAGDPQRVVIISAHIDSRVSDPLNASADAPGADDDASGVAAVLSAARALSQWSFPATIVYAVLSGEEQGLYGGKLLADTARARGWRVEADLNNDIIGNIHGQDGRVDSKTVRIFTEGVRAAETPAMANERRRAGGELDSPSRNLGRFIAALDQTLPLGLEVRVIDRADRFGRGGDQGPLQEAGFPAVRLTEGDENYTRQHQDVRTEGGVAYGDVLSGVDLEYLAKMTRLNIVALAALAAAPPPPPSLKISGAVTADTALSWAPATGASAYRVFWRETSEPAWSHSTAPTSALSLTLPGVNIDDYAFGAASISPSGFMSPVEFPGLVGAFAPAP